MSYTKKVTIIVFSVIMKEKSIIYVCAFDMNVA